MLPSKALTIDETSRARHHGYITLAADATERRVRFVTGGREAKAIAALAVDLAAHGCPPEQIESVPGVNHLERSAATILSSAVQQRLR